MTKKPHHLEYPAFMNSPAETAMYIQRTFKKQGNKHSSVCYCDLKQYMAHVQQMVHIRPQCTHRYHLGICPTMVPRLIFQGKDTVVKCL